MAAGKTKYDCGTRVRIKGIVDPLDKDMNGMTGVLCHPFRNFPIRDVGVRLDATPMKPWEINATVYQHEFEVIEEKRSKQNAGF